ncbi:hypothetical protein C5167_032286 [Papaver somniferum]|uniref:O-fucosyltransferase family protein n=1 Tax=Papaver somniferum TaxID=3469 RepID=A0A4Y7KAC7_PAPSO|nr:O-fucosyltransferase 30-like [Papaver somniferum]RZC69161.1 hypothetical protein C5167_032286 [Papaver somniferum]
MNVSSLGRTKWRKKNPNVRIQPLITILILLFILFFFVFYTDIPNYIFSSSSFSSSSSVSQFPPQCQIGHSLGEKYLWFAPHSGFSNQLSELKNAILIAGILNRTLIVPPILDHHAVALGSCPKFRVLEPNDLRIRVWDHIIQLIQDHRYVSMADIVDLSSLASMIRTVDFRVFTGLWCSLNKNLACIKTSELASSSSLKQCGSLISGMDGNVGKCLYAVKDDCRSSVWTYQQKNGDGVLDSMQPDDELKKKKKISYVRKRRDVLKALGPNTEAGLATVLAFGSLFTSQYKGSELYIDIHEAPLDNRIQSLIKKIEFLPFVPEIRNAGKKFVVEKIKSLFVCAQLRLLDGQFKNHWKATFLGLQQKLETLRNEGSHPIHIFIMTDLPEANWTGSYLEELARDSDAYKLFSLQEGDELVVQTAKKVAVAGHGLKSGSSPNNIRTSKMKKNCAFGSLPSILLYLEESVCSCASLGFVGTAGSTIAESIEIMRKNGICLKQDKIEQ